MSVVVFAHAVPMPQMQLVNERVDPIVVAVDDPALHPEALHIAAACGRPVVTVSDPAQLARVSPRAFALLVDAPFHPAPSPQTFLVASDPADARGPNAFVLPAQAADLLRALGSLQRRFVAPSASGGQVIAVVGAAGGVGASTLAASLSRQAARQGATLVDAHRRSGGLDLLLAVEEKPGARWGEIEFGEGVVAREDVRRALPTTPDGIAVLTYPRTTVTEPPAVAARDVEAVVGAVGSDGVTVLDAPAELVPQRCDLACVVLPAQLRAAAAAAGMVAELAASGIPHALVVRDASWQALSEDELERITASRVLARVGNVRGLTRSVEQSGLPQRLPRPLAKTCNDILRGGL